MDEDADEAAFHDESHWRSALAAGCDEPGAIGDPARAAQHSASIGGVEEVQEAARHGGMLVSLDPLGAWIGILEREALPAGDYAAIGGLGNHTSMSPKRTALITAWSLEWTPSFSIR